MQPIFRRHGVFFDGKINAKGLKPIHQKLVIDVADGPSIPERSKSSAGMEAGSLRNLICGCACQG